MKCRFFRNKSFTGNTEERRIYYAFYSSQEVSNFLLSGYVFYLCIDPEGIYFDIAHQIYT